MLPQHVQHQPITPYLYQSQNMVAFNQNPQMHRGQQLQTRVIQVHVPVQIPVPINLPYYPQSQQQTVQQHVIPYEVEDDTSSSSDSDDSQGSVHHYVYDGNPQTQQKQTRQIPYQNPQYYPNTNIQNTINDRQPNTLRNNVYTNGNSHQSPQPYSHPQQPLRQTPVIQSQRPNTQNPPNLINPIPRDAPPQHQQNNPQNQDIPRSNPYAQLSPHNQTTSNPTQQSINSQHPTPLQSNSHLQDTVDPQRRNPIFGNTPNTQNPQNNRGQMPLNNYSTYQPRAPRA